MDTLRTNRGDTLCMENTSSTEI